MGADGTQGNQTERIILAPVIAQNMGNTDTQRHDKRHGNGAGGNAAGIKGHGKQRFIAIDHQKQCHSKQKHVKQHQNCSQRFAEHDLQNGHHQECANTKAHGIHQQCAIHNGADLTRKDLQIRLRNGDQHTQHKADAQQQSQLFLFGKTGTYVTSHRCHSKVSAQVEQSDSENQHKCTYAECDQFRSRKLKGKDRQQCNKVHDRGDRQGRNQRFDDFIL